MLELGAPYPHHFQSPTLFEERLANIANSTGEELAPLILRPEQYQIGEALAHISD
jgi:hypothetical protein